MPGQQTSLQCSHSAAEIAVAMWDLSNIEDVDKLKKDPLLSDSLVWRRLQLIEEAFRLQDPVLEQREKERRNVIMPK